MTIKKLGVTTAIIAGLLSTTAFASVIDRPFFQSIGVVIVWGDTAFSEDPGFAPIVSDFVLLTPASGTAGADLIDTDVYAVATGTLDPISGAGTAVDRNGTIDPLTGETSGGNFTDNGTSGLLDASDTLAAFGIDAATDTTGGLAASHHTSFYVASNAVFDIFAQSTNVVATGDFLTDGVDDSNISFDLSITDSGTDNLQFSTSTLTFGANAQNPSTGGTGVNPAINSLDDISTQSKVFDGGVRTAASLGTIVDQSVRFDSVYEFDAEPTTAGVQDYDFSMGIGTLQADVTYTIFVP